MKSIQGFDGVTLEVGAPGYLSTFVEHLGNQLHSVGKELILVVPPNRENGVVFNNKIFKALLGSVNYFSLMTYDFSIAG
jgi:spore germination protein YaaH